VSGPPRIGVIVCHCGANIAGVVDVARLAREAADLPGVVHTDHISFACADVAQRGLEEAIAEHDLNRLVVAACTPRTHEPVFREVLSRSGLNPYLLEMVNIRDQGTWVHAHDPNGAQKRARDQIRMGVARAARLETLDPIVIDVTRRVLVLGGGPAGLQAALDLEAHGYEVILVERSDGLGGVLAEPGLHRLADSDHEADSLRDRLYRRLTRSGVRVCTSTSLEAVRGTVGNYEVDLRGPDGPVREQVGAIVLATGARPYDPTGRLGYGEKRNVLTSVDLEQRLQDPRDRWFGTTGELPGSAVFVQCVGSRCDADGCNPGCSRYCCVATLRQAVTLAERGVRVTVYHRDIRAAGAGREELFRRARGAGVLFVRMADGSEPEVLGSTTRARKVVADDAVLGRAVVAQADLVILAVGMVPDTEVVAHLREVLKVPVGTDGFFLERHPELAPVETVVDGVMVCGTAVGAKGLQDALAEAGAAAGKAAQLLVRDTLNLEPTVAVVDPWLCRGCGVCVDMCEFHAPELVTGELGTPVARVQEAACKGCGTCVAWCPSGALAARHFTDQQIDAMLTSMLQWEESP
jgi:heterodisulfide reductase subunit A